MPYVIEKRGKKYHVITRRTGESHGELDNMGDAKAQMRAMFAGHDKKKKARKKPG